MELAKKSACEQGRLLAKGEISCAEITEFYLGQIRKFDPELCAFTHVARRRALWAARQWDRKYHRGRVIAGPLSGVPTGVKDLAFVRGMPTRFGSRALPPLVPPADGLVARRMRAAGMIIAGKLSCSEFGAMPVTEPCIHAPTRNPFDTQYTSGGSSGGSGAAVAGGLLPIAQGSDGAGSIRLPSALGHLVGLKPTRGTCSYVTPVDKDLRLSVVGGLARTVEDCAAFLDILSDRPHAYLESHALALPSELRVKLSTECSLSPTEPEYQRAAELVGSILHDAGGHVEEADWFAADIEEFLVLWKRLMANAPTILESRLQPVTAWLREQGKLIDRSVALQTRKRLESEILDWFGETDLWISPTVAIAVPKVGSWLDPDPERSFLNVVGLGVYTAVFNVSGQPAITVPMGLGASGLPIGVQIAAQKGREDLLLRAAHHIEQSVGGFRSTGALC